MEDKKLQDFLPDINSSYKREFKNENIISSDLENHANIFNSGVDYGHVESRNFLRF